MSDYDAIVIGAGAGGGVVAHVLAAAGKDVLLLERGRALTSAEVGFDHLRNHRLSLYGHNTGPDLDGHPRVVVAENGDESVALPHEYRYQNNAMCVGGGTLVYGAQAWRFLPQDFRMASTYGVPSGSSLADWPIEYGDLEPYYERAEWELGVAGDSSASAAPRRREYPLPPVSSTLSSQVLSRAASHLGWKTTAAPLLINTAPYGGRPACTGCGTCVGFACHNDSKSGTHNTVIPRALASGRCQLVTRALVSRILVTGRRRVGGVQYFLENDAGVALRQATAKTVVVCAGAIETARLLLNSAASSHAAGLGNEHDQVGRHLQGHVYVGAYGLMKGVVYDGVGPGVSIATSQFAHDNAGIVGGGMLANDFVKLPIVFYRSALPPDLPRWGATCKRYVRHAFRRTLFVQGPTQETPNPESRVSVDDKRRDRFGLPVARLSGAVHPETLRSAEFLRQRALEWITAADPERVWSHRPGGGLSAGQHQAGTCRMGRDPRTSVTDAFGRVHCLDNLFIADGSLHVTNGGYNPVLTILALAYRTSEYVAQAL
jgi:choline dehydrogenase-like flavoprotein